MIDIEHDPDGFLVCRVAGRLTERDYNAAIPEIENALGLTSGPHRILIQLDDFRGWDIGALGKEIAFDISHRNDFDRIAVVGQSALEKWGTYLSSPLFNAKVRFFEFEDRDRARGWLSGQVPESC